MAWSETTFTPLLTNCNLALSRRFDLHERDVTGLVCEVCGVSGFVITWPHCCTETCDNNSYHFFSFLQHNRWHIGTHIQRMSHYTISCYLQSWTQSTRYTQTNQIPVSTQHLILMIPYFLAAFAEIIPINVPISSDGKIKLHAIESTTGY